MVCPIHEVGYLLDLVQSVIQVLFRRYLFSALLLGLALLESQAQAQDRHTTEARSGKKQLAQGLSGGRPSAGVVLPGNPATQQLKVLANSSYPSGHLQRGLFLKQKGRKDEALVEFLKAVQENPRQVKAFYEQALIFRERGVNKMACSALEQALAINPAYNEARQLLITLHVQSGNLLAAAGEFGKSLAVSPVATKNTTGQVEERPGTVSSGSPGRGSSGEGSLGAGSLGTGSPGTVSLVPVFKISDQQQASGSVAKKKELAGAEPLDKKSEEEALPGGSVSSSLTAGDSGAVRLVDTDTLKNLVDQSYARQERMIKDAIAAADREDKVKIKENKETDSKVPDSSQPLLERLGSGPVPVKKLTAEQQRLVSMVASSSPPSSQIQEKAWMSKFKQAFSFPKLPLPAVSLPAISLPSWSLPAIKIPFFSAQEKLSPANPFAAGTLPSGESGRVVKSDLQSPARAASPAPVPGDLPAGVARILDAVASPAVDKIDSRLSSGKEPISDELSHRAGQTADTGKEEQKTSEAQKISGGFSKFIDGIMQRAVGKKASEPAAREPALEKKGRGKPAKILVADSLPVEDFGQIPASSESLNSQKLPPEKNDLQAGNAVAAILSKIESPSGLSSGSGKEERPVPVVVSPLAAGQALDKIVQDTIDTVQAAVPAALKELLTGEVGGYRAERLNNHDVQGRSFLASGHVSGNAAVLPVPGVTAVPAEGPEALSLPAAAGTSKAAVSTEEAEKPRVPLPRDVAAILAKLDVRVPAPVALPQPVAEGNSPKLRQPRTLEAQNAELQPAFKTAPDNGGADTRPVVRNTAVAELPLPLPKAPALKTPLQQEQLVPKPLQDALRQAENYLPKPIFEALVKAMAPETPAPLSLGGTGVMPELPSLAAGKASAGRADLPQPIPAQIIDFIGKLAVPSLGSPTGASAPNAAPSFRWLSPAFDNAGKLAVTGNIAAPASRPVPKPVPKPAAPVAPADPILARMQYLVEHGTSSLKQGEAFMYSEETGEGILFMAGGRTERRKLSSPKDAEIVLKERRPDMLLPKDLQYNLTLLGKVMPQKQQPESGAPITGITLEDLQKRESEKGVLNWLKNPFRF